VQALTIEPPAPFPVRQGPLMVLLAGCGGTGSHIAQALARIAAHLRASRAELRLIFCDGDIVEEKNVGRQLFTPADVGKNKALVLATRFNHLFGLAIEAVPEMATIERLNAFVPRRPRSQYAAPVVGPFGILIGAVDTATARKTLHSALAARRGWDLWLDCGNHEHAGQVLLGTHTKRSDLKDAIKVGICAKLPAPSLISPELLAAAPRQRRMDCAAAMEDNVQGLMVNMQVASIAAAYLDALLVRRRISTFETIFDQTTLTMRSTPITTRAIRAVVERAQAHKEAA
jgi:PRTRC genetic system ThiF family protein